MPARVRRAEWLVPLGLTLVITAVSRPWAGLDTPDSSFYASLSLFGSEVTDRAPFDSYYWTRLGYIAPVGLLTGLFGAFPGFLAYKTLLTLVISVSTYAVVRRWVGLWLAAWLVMGVVSSSVVLSYLGNSYLTGSVLAGTAALIALGSGRSAVRASSLLAGGVMGWLVMVNPVGALLGGTLWLALVIYGARGRWRELLERLGLAAASAVGIFGAFLIVGRLLFPTLDWFGTFLATQEITLSNFASDSAVWLGDISLLVPAGVLVIAIANWWGARSSVPAQQALLISSTSLGFMLVFNPMMGGIALEAPMYQAMLWPPALIAVTLVAASRMTDERVSMRLPLVVAALGVVAIIAAGFVDPDLELAVGLGLMIVLVGVVVFSPRMVMATVITVSTFFAGAQLLQNSREDLGLYYLSPYHWAYAANPIETKMRIAGNVQEWLLANTTSSDRILVWVDGAWTEGDRELFVAAGMQLWGENRITLEPTLSDEFGFNSLETVRPTVLALYGRSIDAVMKFWESIPREINPSAPECIDYSWPVDLNSDFPTEQGFTCLTRLSWPEAKQDLRTVRAGVSHPTFQRLQG